LEKGANKNGDRVIPENEKWDGSDYGTCNIGNHHKKNCEHL